MKINDNRDQKRQSFQCLHPIGEIFEYGNEFFMTIEKVRDCDDNYYNAVCLNDGELTYFNIEQVQPLDNVILEIY